MLDVREYFGGLCYHNKVTREQIVANMMYRTLTLFYRLHTIKYCEKLYKLFSTEKDIAKLHVKSTKLLQKIKDPLIDNIAIITAYENYFKSQLLLKGFLIHQIIKSKNEDLFRDQKRHPILIRELKSIEGIPRKRNLDYSFEFLDYKTISIDQILTTPNYKNELNISSEVLLALKNIKKIRNALHFLVGGGEVWNESILFDYKVLLDHANKLFVNNYNKIAKRSLFYQQCTINNKNYSIKFGA